MLRPRELSRSLTLFAAKTPTLPPATHTNSYALGGREVLLIEPATPYVDEQREWIAWARGLSSGGRTPVAILATHHHEDHVGGLDVLAQELRLPVFLHTETKARTLGSAPTITKGDGDTIVLDGPVPETWEVLHTPGHAPGHLCLFNADDRTLIVGDMVASVGTILIAPGDGDMAVYLEQLSRLERLGATLALPAHGDPIDAPSDLFLKYIRHRKMREAKVFSAVETLGSAGGALHELLPNAYNDAPTALLPIARLSLEAHLIKLVAEGAVTLSSGRYRAPAAHAKARE